MTTGLVIVGCGGFGREVHDIVDDLIAAGAPLALIGYVDDAPTESNVRHVERRGARVLGTRSWFRTANPQTQYVIGIGNGSVCREIDQELTGLGFTAATLVHPQASLGFGVELSPGVIICAGARVTTNIRVGRHVHVDRNCVVGHDSVLEDYAIMYPLAALSGGARLGESALLGAAGVVLRNITVGCDAMVGAASLVTRDIPAGALVKGVPAHE